VIAALLACAALAGPDRTAPPPVELAEPWSHPDAELLLDAPGRRVLYVHVEDALDVEVHAISHFGASPRDPATDAAAWLWTWETWARRAWDLAEELDDLGVLVDVWPMDDAVVLEAVGANTRVVPTATLLQDIWLSPRFRRRDVGFHRRESLRELAADPGLAASADAALEAAWYPTDHPWAPASRRDWRRLRRSDVIAAHQAWLTAPMTLVITGDLVRHQLKVLAEALAGPPALHGASATPAPATPVPRGVRVVGVDRPGSAVAAIRLRTPVPPRPHPDHAAMRSIDLAIGQGFASRLHRRLVNELGIAYDVVASHLATANTGTWTVATSVQTRDVGRVIDEVQRALASLGAGGLTDTELAGAAATAVRTWNERAVTLYDLSLLHQELAIGGEALTERREAVLAPADVGAPDTARVANEWLLPTQVWVVEGDREALEPMLRRFDVTWR
jgi:predicted Zn-dependent peptidase